MRTGHFHAIASAMALLGTTTLTALSAYAGPQTTACRLDETDPSCVAPVARFKIPATTPEIWTGIDKRLADAHAASPTLQKSSFNAVFVAMTDLKKLLLALPDHTEALGGVRVDVVQAIDAAVAKANQVVKNVQTGSPGAETVPLSKLDPLVDKIRAYYPDGTFKAPPKSEPTTP